MVATESQAWHARSVRVAVALLVLLLAACTTGPSTGTPSTSPSTPVSKRTQQFESVFVLQDQKIRAVGSAQEKTYGMAEYAARVDFLDNRFKAEMLVASDYVLMPLQAEFLPLKGVKSFLRHFDGIKKTLNKNLKILGFVLTKYDQRKVMNRNVLDQLIEEHGDKVFDTRIRTNIALAAAQEAGVDIFNYSRTSNGALDYMELAHELIAKMRR